MIMARLRRFARAKKGAAALEFAIIAPMMVFLLFGSVDLIDTLGASRRAQNTAASLADVVARDNAVSNAERDGLWAALNVLMFPNSGANMKVRITSVMISSATNARVVWSEGHNGYAARSVGDPVSLPTAMMNPGTSIIMTETFFTYSPPIGLLYNGDVHMRHTAYRRSRLVDPIPRVAV